MDEQVRSTCCVKGEKRLDPSMRDIAGVVGNSFSQAESGEPIFNLEAAIGKFFSQGRNQNAYPDTDFQRKSRFFGYVSG